MLGSAILEVAVGLVFFFLFVSLICSAIGDKISEWLQWRAAFLEKGLREIVMRGDWQSNQEFVVKTIKGIYSHPAIQAQYREAGRIGQVLQNMPVIKDTMKTLIPYMDKQPWVPPYWIPDGTFVLTLLDVLVPQSGEVAEVTTLRTALQSAPILKDTQLQKTLLTLINNGEKTVNEARANIETWFDSSMDQVTELYKRRMYAVALIIGIIVSVTLNVDTIVLANTLWRDPSLRASVAAAASKYASTQVSPSTQVPLPAIRQDLDSLNIPIGWRACPDCSANILGFIPQEWAPPAPWPFKASSDFSIVISLKIVGWLITGFAAAQGAPFWYDLLNKLTQK